MCATKISKKKNVDIDTKTKAIEREKVKTQCDYKRERYHKSCFKMMVQISFSI